MLVGCGAALGGYGPAAHAAPTPVRPPALGPHDSSLATSGDAYVHETREGGDRRWRFGTALAERQVRLHDGTLQLASFVDRTARHELVQGPSDVMAFQWNDAPVTGRSVRWTLDRVSTERLKHGELLLRLALHTATVAVVKCYLVYPSESIVQEWLTIRNSSREPATLTDPAALEMHILQADAPAIDVTYMKGDNTRKDRWRFYALDTALAQLHHVFEGRATIQYAPIQVYQHRTTRAGVFVGWDYLGHWRSTIDSEAGVPGHVTFRISDYRRTLVPGEQVETPKTFTGVFHKDLDEMGHQLLDWQYRYKWDYTRAPYFPGVELMGDWIAGSSWTGDGNGPSLDPVSTYRKVFHIADFMRALGGDTYWRDNGWWDNQGDWNGPNWGETGRYLAQYGMRQTLYMSIQVVDPTSAVSRTHPEWVTPSQGWGGPILDLSQPAVVDWALATLDAKQRQWGDFEWRKDWFPVNPLGDPSRMLGQDQGYRRLVRRFLDLHPGMAFHGCDDGGKDIGYDFLDLGVSWQLNDFFVDHTRGYYPSYLFPPDKIENVPDFYHPEDYTKALWRGLLWNRFPMMLETEDPAKIEGLRELIDIDHYLIHAGVFGRWGFVYHPAVSGDSADWYLERLSGDSLRGVLIPGHALKQPVTIYPKGLRPATRYRVSYQESPQSAVRSGRDLMINGISFTSVPDGEIVYLNLPGHPGNTTDHTPPTPPQGVTQEMESHMDYSGVAVRWQPSHDDNWVSYYEISRDGVLLGKAAKGTYYFDHALGADPAAQYRVTAVDGGGNHSASVPARGRATTPVLVHDDTSRAIAYSAEWVHQTGQWSVANGTRTVTKTRGATAAYAFTGSRVTWYGRMGPHYGTVAVYLDGHVDRVVTTYDADAMANIALYSRVFPRSESHTLKIVTLDTDSVVVDGFQVERSPIHVVPAAPSSGIVYGGEGWRDTGAPLGAPPGGVDPAGRLSSRAGDRATYRFTGRGITWVGRRCSACGMADVYVDGHLETSVDSYSQPLQRDSLSWDETEHVPMFTRHWTTVGRHTLTVVVRPDANLWAKGHDVYLDALQVAQ